MEKSLEFYGQPVFSRTSTNVQVNILETDIDLYWTMALEMHRSIAEGNEQNQARVFICPVGPVYQYRRLLDLWDVYPLDLANVHFFFMDEYVDENNEAIPRDHPLSFRGFIDRELVLPCSGKYGFNPNHVYFPNPAEPREYDTWIADLGGADICFAGVGINGHLAFNEPPSDEHAPSRIVTLTRETITTNSHTALGGAWDIIPTRAVTVGMKSILQSKKLRLYLNRPWQKAVVRSLLYGPVSRDFPASFVQDHPDAKVVMTNEVARSPEFGLR